MHSTAHLYSQNREVFHRHGLKFLVITLACVMLLCVGPESIRCGDAHILHESTLLGVLAQMSAAVGCVVQMFSDSAFPLTRNQWCPFHDHARLDAVRRNFNTPMAVLRAGNEMGIGKVAKYFAFLDFKKNQRLWKQAPCTQREPLRLQTCTMAFFEAHAPGRKPES